MTAYALHPFCPQQYFDANGDPLASGTVYFYAPGGTTPQQTFSDTSGTLNASPGVPLNSQGRPTSGAIFLDTSLAYKMVATDSLGVTIATYDPIFTPPSTLTLRDTDNTNNLILTAGSNLTADRIFTITTGDAARTITFSGNPTLDNWFDQSVKTTASPTFVNPIMTNPTMVSPTISTLLNLTAGQIAFPATQVPSAGANTLDDYEEGTWVPSDGSGASLSITNNGSQYIKIGQIVIASMDVTYPATGNGSSAALAGLPFTNQTTNGWGGFCHAGLAAGNTARVNSAATTLAILDISGTAVTNATVSGKLIRMGIVYRATA